MFPKHTADIANTSHSENCTAHFLSAPVMLTPWSRDVLLMQFSIGSCSKMRNLHSRHFFFHLLSKRQPVCHARGSVHQCLHKQDACDTGNSMAPQACDTHMQNSETRGTDARDNMHCDTSCSNTMLQRSWEQRVLQKGQNRETSRQETQLTKMIISHGQAHTETEDRQKNKWEACDAHLVGIPCRKCHPGTAVH